MSSTTNSISSSSPTDPINHSFVKEDRDLLNNIEGARRVNSRVLSSEEVKKSWSGRTVTIPIKYSNSEDPSVRQQEALQSMQVYLIMYPFG